MVRTVNSRPTIEMFKYIGLTHFADQMNSTVIQTDACRKEEEKEKKERKSRRQTARTKLMKKHKLARLFVWCLGHETQLPLHEGCDVPGPLSIGREHDRARRDPVAQKIFMKGEL